MTLEQKMQQIAAIAKSIQPQLIDAMGVEALHFADDNFVQQGFAGSPWAPRKRTEKGAQRAILIKTGTLRRSLRQENHLHYVAIKTDVPYAKTHNEGDRNQVFVKSKMGTFAPGHYRQNNTPMRKFIGDSPVLRKRVVAAISSIIKHQFKK